ncbi:MAG: phosphatase PAP2 family protein [Flavobacteriaceae bacterium]
MDLKPIKDETRLQMLGHDMGSIFGGMGYAYSRPFHWEGKQWGQAGLVMGTTGVAYLIDDPVSDEMRAIRDDVPKWIRDYGWNIGSPENNFMLTGGVYLTGLISKNEKLRRTGVLLVSSAASAGLLQTVLKSVVGRARPLSGHTKDTFKPFSKGEALFESFPSGHAILAFTNAYAVGKQFENKWVKAGIYTVGLVPGISRIWEGKHWLSDVVFSWAISIFTVEAIDRYLDRRYSEKYNDTAQKNVRWDLTFGPGTLGLVLHLE